MESRRTQSKAKILCDLCVLCGEFKLKPSGANKLKKNTMKTVIHHLTTLALLALVPAVLFAQQVPNTFQNNTVIYAEEINENFEFLAKKFGSSQATVDCTSGATADPDNSVYTSINEALKQHNHLVLTGMCNENVALHPDLEGADLVKWREEDSFTHTYDQSRHRLVILEGGSEGDTPSDGIQLTPDDDSTDLIRAWGQITLVVSKLKLVGGRHGINAAYGTRLRVGNSHFAGNGRHGIGAYENVNLLATDNLIENSTGTSSGFSCGIQLWGNSFAEVLRNTINDHPHGGAVCLHQNASAYVTDNTLSNSRDGIDVRIGSTANVSQSSDGVSEITGNEIGIRIDESSAVRIKTSSIHSNTDDGIRVSGSSHLTLAGGTSIYNNGDDGIDLNGSASLEMWCQDDENKRTTFLNESGLQPNGNEAIVVRSGSSANLCNVELKGHHTGLSVNSGSSANLNNVTVSGSSKIGVYVHNSSMEIRESNLSDNAEEGLQIKRNSHVTLSDTTVSGNGGSGISVSRYSYLDLHRSTISNNTEHGVEAYHITTVDIDDGGADSSTPTTIQSNGSSGINTHSRALIEVEESKPVISGNGNAPISLGADSHMTFRLSDTRNISGTIECSVKTARDPDNASNSMQWSRHPLIEYWDHIPDQDTRPGVSSNCREDY